MIVSKNTFYEQTNFPKTALYFKEEEISEILTVPCQKPDIKNILSVIVLPEVENIKLINTEIGISNEGQVLTGRALIIEVKIDEKITYSADECSQAVHAIHYENFKSFFVIVPDKINCECIYDLFKADKISVNPYVEAIHTRKLDNRTIFQCLFLFIDVKFFD